MGELYSDLDLLDDIIKALGKHGAMDVRDLAKAVGHSETAVLEQLTESYYFQPAATPGKLGRYELSGRGIERFEKIS
jgi:predicted ArsR family transcriptional regulator